MNDTSPYRPEKVLDHLLIKHTIPITPKTSLEFYVWDSEEAMFNDGTDYKEHDFAACCICPGWRRTQKRLFLPKVFAEIHLVNKRFGGGLVSHELQHFILFWIAANQLDWQGKDAEAICKLIGDITSQFWDWFYEHFQLEPA